MDRERTFHELQDMFKGQVDADVVHMVLQENDWKGALISIFCGSHEQEMLSV